MIQQRLVGLWVPLFVPFVTSQPKKYPLYFFLSVSIGPVRCLPRHPSVVSESGVFLKIL